MKTNFDSREVWNKVFPLNLNDHVHVRFRSLDGKRWIDFDGRVYKMEGVYVYITSDNYIHGFSRGANWMVERKNVRKI